MSEITIEQVLEENAGQWMGIHGVEGIAISLFEGSKCILVFSSVDSSRLRANIPEILQGYKVIIKRSGTFQASDNPS